MIAYRCSSRENLRRGRVSARVVSPAVRIVAAGFAAAVGVAVAGCSSAEPADPTLDTPSESVTTTESQQPESPPAGVEGISVPVPPAPDNAVPGEVAFDPCFEVDDALIEQVKFDPASRERQAAEITGSMLLTEIGCSFRRYSIVDSEKFPVMALNVTTSTKTVAELGGEEGHEVIDSAPINGRPAVVYRTGSTTLPACDAAVEAPDGTFAVTLTAVPGQTAVPDPCSEIRATITTLATALPE